MDGRDKETELMEPLNASFAS
jgi:magnesium-transporting ATPase (P-type)